MSGYLFFFHMQAQSYYLSVYMDVCGIQQNNKMSRRLQGKLTPSLCDVCLFWLKCGSYRNIRYTFAIRNNIFFGLADHHKNLLL